MKLGIPYVCFTVILVLEFCPVGGYDWNFPWWVWILFTLYLALFSPGFVEMIKIAGKQLEDEINEKEKKNSKSNNFDKPASNGSAA